MNGLQPCRYHATQILPEPSARAMSLPPPDSFDPPLDATERRLVDAVDAACRDPAADHGRLRQRVRNRAEKYRELARRSRFDGAAARAGDSAGRLALFEALLARLEVSNGDAPS